MPIDWRTEVEREKVESGKGKWVERPAHRETSPANFWDLALAINRSDPAALEIAQNGAGESVSVDPAELRKLLGTVWFRSVFPGCRQRGANAC